MIFWIIACNSPGTGIPFLCDPQKLAYGEIRARFIGCSDEQIPKGHARRGDLVLENSLTRWIFRLPPVSMTEHFGGGIHLIDAAPVGHNDGLLELLPLEDGHAIRSEHFEITETSSGIELHVQGRAQSGALKNLSYILNTNSTQLELSGAENWKLVPLHGWKNDFVHHNSFEDWVYALSEEDEQQYLTLSNWEHIYSDLNLAQAWREGHSDGDWVVHEDLRLRVKDGVYKGYFPQGTLIAQKSGCEDGEPVVENPTVGNCGSLLIRGQDPSGEQLSLKLISDNNHFSVPKNGSKIPLHPDIDHLLAWAGYAHDIKTIERTELNQEEDLLFLRAIPEAYLLLFEEEAYPESFDSLPQGHSNATKIIRSALNQVPFPSTSDQFNSKLIYAAWNEGILSWPWTPKLNKPALGAAPKDLSAEELLIFSLKSNRTVAVSNEWISNALDPQLWIKHPEHIWFDDHSDIEVFMNLLEQGISPTPISKVNWIHVNPQSSWTAAKQKARDGFIAAGNGPWIQLEASDRLILNIAAPRWMNITHAELWVDGELKLHEEFRELPQTFELELDSFTWAVAKAYGTVDAEWLNEPAWVISGSIIDDVEH
ncbi:MAG: hypothetical protein CMK59_06235 [Proteobacteria bacterium]|nr:hypothetical protein [Pseudomonadota bacterium]